MNSKYIAGTAAFIVIAGTLGWFIYAYIDTQDSQQPRSQMDQTAKEKSYSAAEVANHKSSKDCWTIIRGNVYDITSYISRHPGGDEIVRACGEDSTSLFESRTTTSGETVGSGQPHSKAAEQQLERLKIGSVE